jgi:hypothetical protein
MGLAPRDNIFANIPTKPTTKKYIPQISKSKSLKELCLGGNTVSQKSIRQASNSLVNKSGSKLIGSFKTEANKKENFASTLRALTPHKLPLPSPSGKRIVNKEVAYRLTPQYKINQAFRINPSNTTQITTLPGGVKSPVIKDDFKDRSRNLRNIFGTITQNSIQECILNSNCVSEKVQPTCNKSFATVIKGGLYQYGLQRKTTNLDTRSKIGPTNISDKGKGIKINKNLISQIKLIYKYD